MLFSAYEYLAFMFTCTTIETETLNETVDTRETAQSLLYHEDLKLSS